MHCTSLLVAWIRWPLLIARKGIMKVFCLVASITASWCWCHYQLYIKLIKNLIKVITFYEQAFRSIADMDLMLILFAVIYLCNFSLALQIILLLDKNRIDISEARLSLHIYLIKINMLQYVMICIYHKLIQTTFWRPL